jgi:hypothetical protein
MQSQGSASDFSCRAHAFGIIKKTIYTGKSTKFSFDTFVEKLQYAFTVLAETNTAQTEAQKVQTLIENIHSMFNTWPIPTLQGSNGSYLNALGWRINPNYRSTFLEKSSATIEVDRRRNKSPQKIQ